MGDLKVMMELRPCFDGFAGIPQETRVLFSSLHELSGVDPTGLILHPSRRLARGNLSRLDAKRPSAALDRLGRLIISSEASEPATKVEDWRMRSERPRELASLMASTGSGVPIPQYPVDTGDFADYFWQRLFAKGLAPEEMDLVRNARFHAMRPSWLALHSMGLLRRYPVLDTTGTDVLIAHTPWPTRVSGSTRLVVRYHDAIPIFHPHQIKHPRMHQFHHFNALQSNAEHAVFVCVSEATREDLLKVVPHVEDRTHVIPTSVSSDFFPDELLDNTLVDIVRSYLQGGKPPAQRADDSNLRYLLAVSTIEPRKNHLRLIEAWEKLNRRDRNLKLILVGSVGWSQGPIMNRLKKGKQRGDVYHLAGVPTEDLRSLYSNAEAVVCPSVAEGFDMSGIESMMCGTPVIASDIPVHRENYGRAALYFNPYSTQELVEVASGLLYGANPMSRREALTQAGFTQSKPFRRSDLTQRWGHFFDELRAGTFDGNDAR